MCLLWRRYTEFEQLRVYLEVTYLWAIVPPLPEKRPLHTWNNSPTDTFDPDFVDRRRAGLEVQFQSETGDSIYLWIPSLIFLFLIDVTLV